MVKKNQKMAKLKAKYKNKVQAAQLMEFMSALSETEESVVQHNLGPSFDDLRKKHQSRGYYRIITSAFSQRTKSGYVVNRGKNWNKISGRESSNSSREDTKSINVMINKNEEKEIHIS